jgi:hypothetical protein
MDFSNQRPQAESSTGALLDLLARAIAAQAKRRVDTNLEKSCVIAASMKLRIGELLTHNRDE